MAANHQRLALKNKVRITLETNGLSASNEVLNTLVGIVDEQGMDVLLSIMEHIDTEESTHVTAEHIQSLLAAGAATGGGAAGPGGSMDLIQVISAFDVPKILYDPIRKGFYRAPKPTSLLGTAQDKMALYINRFYMLHQRMRRTKGWYKPGIATASNADHQYVELTDLKAMLGVVGETRYVMGCITQMEDGKFFLEDLSASLPLDLSQAVLAHGFFTENSVVVAEGQLLHSGVFQAIAVGLPIVESREASFTAAKGLDFFGGTPLRDEDILSAMDWEVENQEARIVVMADLWLDRPNTLDSLHSVLTGFESLETVPAVFVFMGNFQSFSATSASTDYDAIKQNFSALAAVLQRHRRLVAESKFVFVPGPGDAGPAHVLPRPPLARFLTADLREALPDAVFASNPCRIRYGTQELVLFRDDIEQRMRRQVLVPPSGDSTPDAMFRQLCMTLLQQSHLCPVPLESQAVYWQYDHALALYPLPHLLVLADSVPPNQTLFQDCQCLNPGSFVDGTFATYMPAIREVELCDVPDAE